MAYTVAELIDERPLSGFQIRTISLCGMVLLLDGFDTQCIGFLAPAIAAELGLAMRAFGPVFSAALIGLMIGALASGPIADRLYRISILDGSSSRPRQSVRPSRVDLPAEKWQFLLVDRR